MVELLVLLVLLLVLLLLLLMGAPRLRRLLGRARATLGHSSGVDVRRRPASERRSGRCDGRGRGGGGY